MDGFSVVQYSSPSSHIHNYVTTMSLLCHVCHCHESHACHLDVKSTKAAKAITTRTCVSVSVVRVGPQLQRDQLIPDRSNR